MIWIDQVHSDSQRGYADVSVGSFTAYGTGSNFIEVANTLAASFNNSPDSPVTAKVIPSGSYMIALYMKKIGTARLSIGESGGDVRARASGSFVANNPEMNVWPKFVILAMIYAPPGPASSVSYGESTKLGTSTTIDHLTENKLSLSAEVNAGGEAGPQVSAKLSAEWAQSTDDASTIAIDNTTSLDKRFYGSIDALDGIDHDADHILLWINPQVDVKATSDTSAQWRYNYDSRDPANGMDIFDITVADLKAWIAGPIPANVSQVLNRTWSGRAITTEDLVTILAQNPFQKGFGDSDVFDFNPDRFVLQTSTGPITYKSPQIGYRPDTYTLTNLSQISRSDSSTVTSSYTVAIEYKVGNKFPGGEVNFGASSQQTWKNKSTDVNSFADSKSASVSITGPAAPTTASDPVYTGPTQIQVYLDTLYNSYVFGYVRPDYLRSNLVAYYPFAGDMKDYSGHQLNAGNHGATLTTDRKGVPRGAGYFNGSSYLSLPNSSRFNNLSSFTLTAWIKPEKTNVNGVILSKLSPNRDFVLDLSPAGGGSVNAHFAHSSTYYQSWATNPKVQANTWTYIAATWTGTFWRIYINGSLASESSTNGKSPLWTGTDLEIGAHIGGAYGFVGSIDEVRVYNKALDQGAINWLMWQ